jgi:glycosyltransferase involved in cell wall biosynthesis
VPNQRFTSNLKNYIYKAVNKFSYKNADEVWDLSARMSEARKKYWDLNESDYKKRLVVPYGVWTRRIKKYSYEECEKNTLVFMGHLLEKQGVQVVIRIIPSIVKINPNFKFKIIGDGKYKSSLEKLAEKLGVSKYCDFLGRISDEQFQVEIAKSCVAIAPYVEELDTWTYYADPGKIKEYLACGVPVLLTDVPWNAHEIEEKHCGEIVNISNDGWVFQLIDLMEQSKNTLYRNSAREYSISFDNETIFNSLGIR